MENINSASTSTCHVKLLLSLVVLTTLGTLILHSCSTTTVFNFNCCNYKLHMIAIQKHSLPLPEKELCITLRLNADMANVTYQWNVSFKSQSMVSHVFSLLLLLQKHILRRSLHQSSLMESETTMKKISLLTCNGYVAWEGKQLCCFKLLSFSGCHCNII